MTRQQALSLYYRAIDMFIALEPDNFNLSKMAMQVASGIREKYSFTETEISSGKIVDE